RQATSPTDLRRHVVRLSGELLLGTARLIAEAVDSDMVTGCIFLAIMRANVRDITRASQDTGAYSGLPDIPPDALRHPVSVYAIAREMKIPYETVRRHVAKLAAANLCRRVEDGLVAPQEVFQTPRMMRAVEENWKLTLWFLKALAEHGIEAPPRPGAPRGADMSRQVLRLSIGMFLDAMARLTEQIQLDLVHAVLYVTIAQANVRHLTTDFARAEPFASLEAPPPDSERRPVSVYAVAREMRLPYETARRHVGRMMKMGLLVRMPDGGLITPSSLHRSPRWVAATHDSWRSIEGYLGDLAHIGVTARSA
ncbi:MAG TPA: hypothetical protein VFW47_07500, partial [Phenylobacterium sp.]|nr:hypothetical protein [Phenylobacterium sp.]